MDERSEDPGKRLPRGRRRSAGHRRGFSAVMTGAVRAVRQKGRGHSSAGRAPALQAGCRRFDPVWLHHFEASRAGRGQIAPVERFEARRP